MAVKEDALSVALVKEDALLGTTAVVTGGSRGLGREMALALARAGAFVYAGGRTPEAVEETISLASDASGSVEPLAFDVADSRAVAPGAWEIHSARGVPEDAGEVKTVLR